MGRAFQAWVTLGSGLGLHWIYSLGFIGLEMRVLCLRALGFWDWSLGY